MRYLYKLVYTAAFLAACVLFAACTARVWNNVCLSLADALR